MDAILISVRRLKKMVAIFEDFEIIENPFGDFEIVEKELGPDSSQMESLEVINEITLTSKCGGKHQSSETCVNCVMLMSERFIWMECPICDVLVDKKELLRHSCLKNLCVYKINELICGHLGFIEK